MHLVLFDRFYTKFRHNLLSDPVVLQCQKLDLEDQEGLRDQSHPVKDKGHEIETSCLQLRRLKYFTKSV